MTLILVVNHVSAMSYSLWLPYKVHVPFGEIDYHRFLSH